MADSPKIVLSRVADPGAVILRQVRIRKEDAAWVYTVFESHEGLLSYTTLDHLPGDLHRDLTLSIPANLAQDAQRMLDSLGDLIYVLNSDPGHERSE